MRVPLVMRWPKGFGGQGGVRVPHPVTLLDVAPTILAAAGVPGTALPTHGESLLPLHEAYDRAMRENPGPNRSGGFWVHG